MYLFLFSMGKQIECPEIAALSEWERERKRAEGRERMEAPLAQTLVKNTLILNEYFTAFKLTE